ncbi:DUF1488 domain-containing protein [Bradyrhizobium sp.]|uniref:DUF1488 domain-containing protein n=2 Tax=Bradyrhizobium sp. TaxID=376 RepID=UPI002616973C|nr:DUF1488 domain-containing protein [Bradyrhizobium sp.]
MAALVDLLERGPQQIVASAARLLQPTGALVPIEVVRQNELAQVIDFPNHSRSYDPTRRVVRFWGHDSAIEASFFISQDALTRIQPGIQLDEPSLLNAFDANREKICAAAARVYVRGGRGWYDLGPANF